MVHHPGSYTGNQAIQHFINLSRMARQTFIQLMPLPGTDKFKSPRQRVDIRISRNSLNYQNGYRSRQSPQQVSCGQTTTTHFSGLLFRVPHQSQNDGEHPSVTCQPAFPNLEYFNRMGAIIVPFIKQTVPQTAPMTVLTMQ
mgnify:CR=1 FL=1